MADFIDIKKLARERLGEPLAREDVYRGTPYTFSPEAIAIEEGAKEVGRGIARDVRKGEFREQAQNLPALQKALFDLYGGGIENQQQFEKFLKGAKEEGATLSSYKDILRLLSQIDLPRTENVEPSFSNFSQYLKEAAKFPSTGIPNYLQSLFPVDPEGKAISAYQTKVPGLVTSAITESGQDRVSDFDYGAFLPTAPKVTGFFPDAPEVIAEKLKAPYRAFKKLGVTESEGIDDYMKAILGEEGFKKFLEEI